MALKQLGAKPSGATDADLFLPSATFVLGANAAGTLVPIAHGLNNFDVGVVMTRSALPYSSSAFNFGDVIDVSFTKTDNNNLSVYIDRDVIAGEYLIKVYQLGPAPEQVGPTAGAIAASNITTNSLTVTITGGADAGIGNAGVYWYRNSTGTGTPFATTAGDVLNDTGLSANTNYTYTARRFDYYNNLGAVSAAITPKTVALPAAPVFDSATIGPLVSSVTTATGSWTHGTIGGTAATNLGILAVYCCNGGAQSGVPPGTPTASIAGVSLTFLGYQLIGVAQAGWVAVFAGLGITPGTAKTATYSIAAASGTGYASVYPVSYVYQGVGSISALASAGANSGTAVAVPISSGTNHQIWGSFSNYQTNTYSGLSYTERKSQYVNIPGMSAGEMAGVASASFAATQNASNYWGGVAVDMLPVAA